MSDNIVIVSGVRTAIGKFGGALKDIPVQKLGAIVIREAVKSRRCRCYSCWWNGKHE